MLAKLSLTLLLTATQLSQAINVYLRPPPSFLHTTLVPEDASAALSRHLGVEHMEPLRDLSQATFQEEIFVGQGPKRGLLLTLEDTDAEAVLPHPFTPTFTLNYATDGGISSLSSVISTYMHRARQAYSSLYSSSGSLWKVDDLEPLGSFFSSAESSAFAAVELTTLSNIREEFGQSSDEYTHAAAEIRFILDQLINTTPGLHIAILTFSPDASHSVFRRQDDPEQSPFPPNRPTPQEPIGSISTCFITADSCNNGTNTCSGRGQCVEATKAGRTCFVCTCGITQTGEGNQVKTDVWVGESCERKDISGPFVLFAGTVIVMIILVFGSISLLYSIGDLPLPSTLLATAVVAKKD